MTPLDVLTGLVTEFVQGRTSAAEFRTGLDKFEAYVQQVAAKVAQLELPEEYPESGVMADYSQRGLAHFVEAIGRLRELPEPNGINEALAEAAEGQELIAELVSITRNNLEAGSEGFYAC